MGNTFIEFFRSRVSREEKRAFLSAFIAGLLVHIYKFSNTLPNSDSLYNFYDPQNIVASGRWFLSVACAPSSFFDLPWVTGLFSLVYISLTAAVVVRLLGIKDPVAVVLGGALIASYPGMTETFFYGFTADGYFLAMLLAALAVLSSSFECKKPWQWAVSAVLLCLACGIYQAYVSFALVLTAVYFIGEMLEGRRTNGEAWLYIGRQAAIYAVGMILYYVVWRICLAAEDAEAVTYLGIDAAARLEFLPSNIIGWLTGSRRYAEFMAVECTASAYGMNLYGVLNIVFLAAAAVGTVIAAVKSGLFRRRMQLVLSIAAAVAIPLFACIWLIVSPDMVYRPMMLVCYCLLPVFAAALFARWLRPWMGNIFAVVLALIILNNGVLANISYFYMHSSYERSYATALEMTTRMHMIANDDEIERIAIVGAGEKSDAVILGYDEPSSHAHILTGRLRSDLMYDREHIYHFLEGVLGVDFRFASNEECAEFAEQPDIADMGVWPAKDSMRLCNGVLIIKIGQY